MITDNEREFHLHAFVGFLSFAARELVPQFEHETGFDYAPGRTPIDRMIDAATGHDRYMAEEFIKWAAGQYGKRYLPDDYLTQLMKPNPKGGDAIPRKKPKTKAVKKAKSKKRK